MEVLKELITTIKPEEDNFAIDNLETTHYTGCMVDKIKFKGYIETLNWDEIL